MHTIIQTKNNNNVIQVGTIINTHTIQTKYSKKRITMMEIALRDGDVVLRREDECTYM